jgi:CrcB protein
MLILAIAAGSALGGVARYLLGGWVQRLSDGPFPMGTLLVNITGSFVLGFILRFTLDSAAVSPETRAFLTIGFCGGYTTFSTFSYETARLLEDGEWTRAAVYIGASAVLSIIGTIAGFHVARELTGPRSG